MAITAGAREKWDYTFHKWGYQVVPGTRRGGSFQKGKWLIGIHGELERSELKLSWKEVN